MTTDQQCEVLAATIGHLYRRYKCRRLHGPLPEHERRDIQARLSLCARELNRIKPDIQWSLTIPNT